MYLRAVVGIGQFDCKVWIAGVVKYVQKHFLIFRHSQNVWRGEEEFAK